MYGQGVGSLNFNFNFIFNFNFNMSCKIHGNGQGAGSLGGLRRTSTSNVQNLSYIAMGRVQVVWFGAGELQLQTYLQLQLYLRLQLELQSTWQWAGCRRFAVRQRTRQSGIFLLDFISVVFLFLVASLLLFILICLLLLCLCLCLCLLFCLLLCLALLLRFLSLTLFSFFLITTPFTRAAFLLEVKDCSIFFSVSTLSTLPS